MIKGDTSDPFWITEDGSMIFRGIPVATPGKEHGLRFRLECIKNVKLGPKILSVGCGVAAELKALKQKDFTTIGLDPSNKFLNEAKKSKNADYIVQAVGENLPLGNETFDSVLLFEVLEHSINPEQTMKEINRILKPGGLLYLTVPNRFFILDAHGIVISNTVLNNMKGVGIPFFSMFPKFLRKGHERARIYDQAMISLMLRKTGFSPAKISYLMPPIDILKDTTLISSMRKCFFALSKVPIVKMLGANVMVLSKKN